MELINSQPIRLFAGEPETQMPLLYTAVDRYQLALSEVDVYADKTNWCRSGDFTSTSGWTFTNGGSGVSIITVAGVLAGTGTGLDTLTNSYVLAAARIYKITIVVDTLVSGSVNFTNIGSVTKAGTYTFYWSKTFNQRFKLTYGDGDAFTISSITINDVTDNFSHKVGVVDSSGNFDGLLASPTFNNGQIVFNVDINSIASGVYDKYQLNVYDPTVNEGAQNYVPNGLFSNDQTEDFKWTEVVGGTNVVDVLQDATTYHHFYRLTSQSIADSSLSQNILTVGVEYDITFDIETDASNTTITVFAGSASSGELALSTGSYNVTLACATTTELKFLFSRKVGVTPENIEISNIQVTKTTGSDYVSDYKSTWFDFDADSGCNSILITAFRENPAFGLNFGTLFQPVIRVAVTLRATEYESDVETFRNLDGRSSNYWFDQLKLDTYETHIEHRSVHDWLALLGAFDSVYINEDEHFVPGNYQYTPDDMLEYYGTGRFTVGEKTQNTIVNQFDISTAGVTVTIGSANIVDPQGNNITDPSSNQLVSP